VRRTIFTNPNRTGDLQDRRSGRIIMAMQGTGGKFALPCFDQEQGNGARGMNGKPCNSGINTGVAPHAAVGVARVRAQCTYPLDDSGKPAKGGPHIGGDLWIEVDAVGVQDKGLLHGIEEALHVLLGVTARKR
jgi:hypothetical protein